MNNFNDLVNELMDKSDVNVAKFVNKLSGTEIENLGIRIPVLKELVKKYKDLDMSTFKIKKIYEYMFMYFSISLKQSASFKDGINFIVENQKYWIGWNLTDTVYQYLKFPKDFDVAKKSMSKLLNHKNQYVRRLFYLICMKYEKNVENLEYIFSSLKDDNEYYVQMVESWLICDLYILHQDETFMFLKETKLGKIIVNKAISKIHDSYRVSEVNKELVKTLRK